MPLDRLFRRPWAHRLASVIAMLAIAGCSPAPTAEPALPPEAVALGDSGLWLSAPSLRPMPAMAMGAAYFTVHNRGRVDDRLLAVRVETSEGATAIDASLHETTLVDGVSRMRSREDGFALEKGEDLVLAPGGAHVMLSGTLPEPPLDLTLRFENAGEFTVSVPVPAP